MMPREPIPTVVRKLAKELAEPTPMRRGSVSERFMKCGQKECRCQHDPQARHGPYFSLTRSEEGKTRSRYHEVWSKGVSVPARPAGAARPVL